MDKQTLSNYGWIVVTVLVLAIMLALATPFGTYVGDAVVSVANGFVGSSNQAIDDDNIGQMQNKWEEKLSGIGATFNAYLTNPDCHSFGPEHSNSCFAPINPITLTWGELKLVENGAKYGYDASAISDTTIGEMAFLYCKGLTNITLPDSITTIGHTAFSSTSLKNITIPNGVTTISNSAFDSCKFLESITLPDSVTSIEANSFMYCASLKSINLPDSITDIQYETFCGCTSLTSITIPEGVTTIGNFAFEACTSLTSINFEGTKSQWNTITLPSNWNSSVPATVVHCTDGDITL